jgi:hypothetical protein
VIRQVSDSLTRGLCAVAYCYIFYFYLPQVPELSPDGPPYTSVLSRLPLVCPSRLGGLSRCVARCSPRLGGLSLGFVVGRCFFKFRTCSPSHRTLSSESSNSSDGVSILRTLSSDSSDIRDWSLFLEFGSCFLYGTSFFKFKVL